MSGMVGNTVRGQEITSVTDGLTLLAGVIRNDFYTGKAGGLTVKGDTASGGDLTLTSTAHATKGKIYLGSAHTSYFNEATGDLVLSRHLGAVNGVFTGNVSGVAGTFSGAVSGTTGTFSSHVVGVNGTFSGAVSGTTGTFSSHVVGVNGTFSGNVSGVAGAFSGAVSGTTGTFSSHVVGVNGTFSGDVSGVAGAFTGAVTGVTGAFSTSMSSPIVQGGAGSAGTMTIRATAHATPGMLTISGPVTISLPTASAADTFVTYAISTARRRFGARSSNPNQWEELLNASWNGSAYAQDDVSVSSAKLVFASSTTTSWDMGFSPPGSTTFTSVLRLSPSGVAGTSSASGNLTLISTTDATKGLVRLGSSSGFVYDDTTGRIGLGRVPDSNAEFTLHAASGGDNPRMHFTNTAFTGTGSTDGTYLGLSNNTQFLIMNYEASSMIFGTSGGNSVEIDSSRRLIAYTGIYGSASASGTVTLSSTTHATKGKIIFGLAGTNVYDEVNDRWGYGIAIPTVDHHTEKGAASIRTLMKNTTATGQSAFENYVGTVGITSRAFGASAASTTVGGITAASACVLFAESGANGFWVGNTNNAPMMFGTNNVTRIKIFETGKTVVVGTSTLLGVSTAVGNTVIIQDTSNTVLGQNVGLLLSGAGNTGQYSQLGLGWSGNTSFAPAVIAYLATSGTGSTTGDIVFATRQATTDTAPVEVFRMGGDGICKVTSGNLYIDSASTATLKWRISSSDKLALYATASLSTLESGNPLKIVGGGSFTTNINLNSTGIAFFNGTAVAKQTVTGSKGGNAAVTSLMTALAAYNIVTDSTS